MVIGAAVVAAALVVLALTMPPAVEREESDNTPTEQSSDHAAVVPAVAPMIGAIRGWSTASSDVVSAVLAAGGAASDGDTSAFIDAPVIDGTVTALSVEVPVEPGMRYRFAADVRLLTSDRTPCPVSMTIGENEIQLPDLNADWLTIEETWEAGPGTAATTLNVVLRGPVSGLGVDNVRFAPEGGSNLVSNPSFENVDVPPGIVNESLLMTDPTSAVVVAGTAGAATWVLERGDQIVEQGQLEISGPVGVVPLQHLEAGFYRFSVQDSSETWYSASIGLLDVTSVRIPVDERFGAMLHVEQPVYRGAGRLAASVGYGSVRNDILWSENERTVGQYEFDERYVREFGALKANGVGLLGILSFSNPHYDEGRTPSSEQAVEAYGRYAGAVAEQFEPDALEVYNEFNHEPFNNGSCGTSAGCYIPLVEAAQRGLSASADHIPLIVGATALYDAPWFDALWQAGGIEYADAVSFHPYEVAGEPERLAGVVATANESMRRVAGESRPIWVSELGWTTNTGGSSHAQQAGHLIRAQVIALSAGVERIYWYDLINDGPDLAAHEGNFGLFLHGDSSRAALEPKLAAYAQAQLVTQLDGRPFREMEDAGPEVISAAFGEIASPLRVVWAPGGEAVARIEATARLTVTDLAGAVIEIDPVDGVAEVPVTDSPVYVNLVESTRTD